MNQKSPIDDKECEKAQKLNNDDRHMDENIPITKKIVSILFE